MGEVCPLKNGDKNRGNFFERIEWGKRSLLFRGVVGVARSSGRLGFDFDCGLWVVWVMLMLLVLLDASRRTVEKAARLHTEN